MIEIADIEFRRPLLEDQDLITSYFQRFPSRSCDRTFANVFLWAKHYHVEFARYKDVILFRDNSAGIGYAFPVGEDAAVKDAILELSCYAEKVGQPFVMYGITEDNFT